MPSPRLLPCDRRMLIRVASSFLALCVLIGPDGIFAQQLQVLGRRISQPAAQFASGHGVYLPTERTSTRGIAEVREDLQSGEYSRAIHFLSDVLQREEDVFVFSPESPGEIQGLKETARQLIRQLPSRGYAIYELQNSPTARKLLDEVMQERNEQALAGVARHYVDTPAGNEAAWILAQMEADRGHVLTAALIYQELLQSDRARRMLGPQLLLQTALNLVASGRTGAAEELIDHFADEFAGQNVTVAGQTIPVSRLKNVLLDILAVQVSQSTDPTSHSNWKTYRADAARSNEGSGGLPLLRERWRVRSVNQPRAEAYLAGREREFRRLDQVALPVASPIAVGDVVVFSTPRNVVSVDWQSGKRIWETRPDPDDGFEQLIEGLMQRDRDEDWPSDGKSLERRIWNDFVITALSSDGERVYAIRGIPFANDQSWSRWDANALWGGNAGGLSPPTNRLSVFDLATEGKLVWEIDGSRADGVYDNVFFLGAPLAIDGSLYVLGEVNSAVYLFAIQPTTGKPIWKQQIASLELGIGLDPRRRLTGANLSYEDGILVCPTGAGVVVGIDLLNRSLAWAYSVALSPESMSQARQILQRGRRSQSRNDTQGWQEASVVIAQGCVLLVSPGSSHLHCVDLFSGKPIWKSKRGNALFVACVSGDTVLLVEPSRVQGVRLADGGSAWATDGVELPHGTTPSGRGFVSRGRYLLPLSSGEVIAIEVDTGEITGSVSARDGKALGNLIYHRDAIVSQNSLFVEKFEQADALEQRAVAALEEDSNDAAALRDLAELTLARGDLAKARDLLKRAYNVRQNDPVTNELLGECLLALLNDDFAEHRDDLELVRSLVRTRQQEIDLLRVEITGLLASNEPLLAFQKGMRHMDMLGTTNMMLSIGVDHSVRCDVWLRNQFAKMWAAASPEDRDTIEATLVERRRAWQSPGVEQFQRYLSYFGRLPDAEKVRLDLARKLMDRRDELAAELELLCLENAENAGIRGTAADWMQELKEQFANDGRYQAVAWPQGAWNAEVVPVAGRRGGVDGRRARNQRRGMWKLRVEQRFGKNSSPHDVFVSDDRRELIGRDRWGDVQFRADLPAGDSRLAQLHQSGTFYAAQIGHLLCVSLGSHIAVFDTWQSSATEMSPLVWSDDVATLGDSPRPTRRQAVADRSVYDLKSLRTRLAGRSGRLVGVLGPATPSGIVYQKDDELRCGDPLSGDILWQRTDIPPGCELFGDAEHVFAVPPGESTAYMVAMADGELVDRRSLPPTPWLLTAGSHVVDLDATAEKKLSVSITDAANGESLFHASYDPHAQFRVIEPDRFAVMEPSGRFQLIDVTLAKAILEAQLPAERASDAIHVLCTESELFLFVNRDSLSRHVPHSKLGVDYPMATGPIYAFNLSTGEPLWSAPANVRHRGVVLPAPSASPLLLFADRVTSQEGGENPAKLRLMCLEKDTGRSVYWNDALPNSAGGKFDVEIDAAGSTVTIETSESTITLAATDAPQPPEPPAQDDVESKSKRKVGGLWGIGRRMGQAIQEALQDPRMLQEPDGAGGDQNDEVKPPESDNE